MLLSQVNTTDMIIGSVLLSMCYNLQLCDVCVLFFEFYNCVFEILNHILLHCRMNEMAVNCPWSTWPQMNFFPRKGWG